MTALEPSERTIHSQIVTWLRFQHRDLCVHHSPNEGRRGWHAQRDVKDLGVMAGWPDLQIIDLHGRHLYLEVKRNRGRLSAQQEACLASLRARGCAVEVVRSLEEAATTIEEWLRYGGN